MVEDKDESGNSERKTKGLSVTGQWKDRLVIGISIISLVVSVAVAYENYLKPFRPTVAVDPTISFQHKMNMGLYASIDLTNDSPRSGLISNMAVVLYRENSKEDKYLLEFTSFRVPNQQGVYEDSKEQFPLWVPARAHINKLASFVYMSNVEFPISMGTYVCEVLVFEPGESRAAYVKSLRFEMTSDLLSEYLKRRESGSTTLTPVTAVGYSRPASKKLSSGEYDLMR